MDETNSNNADSETATIVLEVPRSILQKFGETPAIRSRAVLEALAIECYRTSALSNPLCARLLNMTDLEFQQLRREREVPSNMPVEYFLLGFQAMAKHLSKK